jgi:hypothetical protein
VAIKKEKYQKQRHREEKKPSEEVIVCLHSSPFSGIPRAIYTAKPLGYKYLSDACILMISYHRLAKLEVQWLA